MTRPLSGLKIVSFEQYGAGPFGTQILADLGADVLKVEPPAGGDYARSLGPWFLPGAAEADDGSLYFQSLNRNKRSMTLNAASPAGREIVRKLARGADAFFNNLRGDAPEKLGLTHAQLREANPKLVCVHCSGYGRSGPRRQWPGYDYLMQAEAGYFQLSGEPDSSPNRLGLSVVDYMGGTEAALALLAGVLGARETGEGRDLDVSLRDAAFYNLNYLAAWGLNGGEAPSRARRSAHPSLSPCQLYKTADGWIYLMCNKEKFWPLLCEKTGRPDLAADPRFLTFKERLKNREALTEVLDEILSARATDEWLAEFGGTVPAAKIASLAEALENAGDAVCETRRADGTPVRTIACPVRFNDDGENRPAPRLGEHSDEALRALGCDDREIAQLREKGTV